jgi:colanic acid biosynthesis glycosyl transferase WcaI
MSGPGGIVFVNRSYWPEETATAQLLTDLAEALAARGRKVTVIARATRSMVRSEFHGGVQIERVPAARWDGPGMGAKAAQFLSFWAGARHALSRALQPGDSVVTLTDPPLFGIAATAIARRRGATSWHWLQDIYPEVARAVTGQAAWMAFRPWRDRAWRRAAGCVTLGADMGALVAERGIPTECLFIQPNWAPAGLRPPPAEEIRAHREPWGAAGQFVLGYSGNLGRVHDLDAVLALAEALKNDSDIRFQITGTGPQRARIQAEAAARGLTHVHFAPPAPRDRLAAALASADAHLVTLRPGCERCVFPSKLYGIAAVGCPVLFLGPIQSEIGRLIASSGMGIAADASDPAGAALSVRAWRDDPERRRAAAAAALRFGAAHAGPGAAADLWDRLTRSR